MYLRRCVFILLPLLIFTVEKLCAQTCTASLGDPIVNINFGAGSNFGPPLAAGTTSFLQYQASTCPVDGNYSIVNYTSGCWPNDVVWHTATDHTGNTNNDGYYMLVNASHKESDFYIQTVDGLCGGTTYQFAAWLLDMCSVTGILPNITFTIEGIDGSILSTYNTGDIPIINPVTWQQYGFFFTTPPSVTKVVLRMHNNAPGGVGNDLGLDDITFRPAGPAIEAAIAGQATDTINLCTYDTTALHFVSTVENCYGSTAYQWQLSKDNGANWNNIPGATGNAYTRIATAGGAYLYRLTAAEAANIDISNCRVASKPIRVNVVSGPVINITGNAPKCSGEAISLVASGGSKYNWSGPNGFLSNVAQLTFSQAAIANAGKYRVSVTDSTGCISVDSVTVEVYKRPVAAFAVANPACENSALNFTDQSVTGGEPITKWTWDFGDGTSSALPSPTHVLPQSGNYRISLYVENDKGCKSDTITKEIIVHPLPIAAFGLPGICLADPFAQFTDSSSIADNSASRFLYAWDFGDINATAVNPNTSSQKDPRHIYTSTGIYQVGLTVTSEDGCKKDTIEAFTVNGSQPVAKFTTDPGVDFCSDKDVIITDGSSVNFGNITRVEIYWDYQNDPSLKAIDLIPVAGKKYLHRYPGFNQPVTKTANIRYLVYSGISCVDEALQSITLKASPQLQFDSLTSVCENATPFVLTQGHEMNGLPGTGSYNGPGVTADNIFDPNIALPGEHLIRYTFSGTNGCNAFAERSIRVLEQPAADAGDDKTILRGGFAMLSASPSGSGLQYEWMPDIAIDDNHIAMPKVSPQESIIYRLKVTSADGCAATDSVMINVVSDIYVPTAFSPNGDGLNDTWRIPAMASDPASTIDVFNRFGQLVYHAQGGTVGWDGTYKGKPLPVAGYTWILHPGNGRKLLYGTVMIVK